MSPFWTQWEGVLPHPHPQKYQEEVVSPARPTEHYHPEEIGFHAAAHKFRKMWEPKISKLKGGYSSSAGLIIQSWLKDICVHVEDRRLMQREVIQLVKDFTAECARDELEFYMGMMAGEDQSFKGDHVWRAYKAEPIICIICYNLKH